MTVRKEYRVNGSDNYVIDYVPQSDGTIDLYCRLHPSDQHGRGPAHHHLYETGNICVSAGREPKTLRGAATIATAWMEGYSEYCRTGEFPTG